MQVKSIKCWQSNDIWWTKFCNDIQKKNRFPPASSLRHAHFWPDIVMTHTHGERKRWRDTDTHATYVCIIMICFSRWSKTEMFRHETSNKRRIENEREKCDTKMLLFSAIFTLKCQEFLVASQLFLAHSLNIAAWYPLTSTRQSVKVETFCENKPFLLIIVLSISICSFASASS